MATTTPNQTSEKRSWEQINWGDILLGLALLAGTSYLLFLGFRFLQTPELYLESFIDPLEQPLLLKSIITVFAIIWGVAGMVVVFYLLNMIADGLPHMLQQYVTPYIFVLPASALLIYTLGLTHNPHNWHQLF